LIKFFEKDWSPAYLTDPLPLLMLAEVILDLLGEGGIRGENLLHFRREILHDLKAGDLKTKCFNVVFALRR